jgi:hypothetical protein
VRISMCCCWPRHQGATCGWQCLYGDSCCHQLVVWLPASARFWGQPSPLASNPALGTVAMFLGRPGNGVQLISRVCM